MIQKPRPDMRLVSPRPTPIPPSEIEAQMRRDRLADAIHPDDDGLVIFVVTILFILGLVGVGALVGWLARGMLSP